MLHLASVLTSRVLTETEVSHPIFMPPIAFAAVAFFVFLFLGVVTWTYRDVANRHATKAASGHHDDHTHGDPAGLVHRADH